MSDLQNRKAVRSQKTLISTIQPRPFLTIEVGRMSEERFKWIMPGINFRTSFICQPIPLLEVPTELNLGVVSVEDLGFKRAVTYLEILAEAFQHGLKLCPEETPFIARISYVEQQPGERLYFATKPFRNCFSGLEICVLGAEENNYFWLGGSVVARPYHRGSIKEETYGPKRQFVFVQ